MWQHGDAKGYSDVLPFNYFSKIGSDKVRKHLVNGPDGSRHRAQCRVKIAEAHADLDYTSFPEFNTEQGMELGVMRLVFEDSRRTLVREVLWKDQHATRFAQQKVTVRSRHDYEAVLGDVDRLLPLYQDVEINKGSGPVAMPPPAPFVFRPGCSAKASSAVAHVQTQLDIVLLRHNELQRAPYNRLISQYGRDEVSTEQPNGVGSRIDVVVRRGNGYWFYEIKTAESPRDCLREAIGQLLEYAFWPGGQGATRLIVVGEAPFDNEGLQYLRQLKERFSLPIEYEQISI